MSTNLRAVATFSTCAALAACTHTHEVRTPKPRSEDEFVTTKSGRRVEARAQGDGWVTLTGDFIKPEQVESTEGRHFGRGALEGLGIGAAAGGATGLIVGSIAAREDGWLILFVPALTILGSAAGGLTGVVIGSAIGSNDVQRRVAPRLQVVPTSSGARAQLSWNF